MKSKRTRALFLAAAAGVLMLGLAGPACAAETSATVTVTGGALSITVPVSAGNLGTLENTVSGGTISGQTGRSSGERRARRRRGFRLGGDRHLDSLHAEIGADDWRRSGRLYRRGDHEGWDSDVHGE